MEWDGSYHPLFEFMRNAYCFARKLEKRQAKNTDVTKLYMQEKVALIYFNVKFWLRESTFQLLSISIPWESTVQLQSIFVPWESNVNSPYWLPYIFFTVTAENFLTHQGYLIVVDFRCSHLLSAWRCTDMVFPLSLKETQCDIIAVLKLKRHDFMEKKCQESSVLFLFANKLPWHFDLWKGIT